MDDNFATEIFKLVFTPSAIVFVFAYILRKYFDKSLSKDIEKYKIELKNENDKSRIKLESEFKKQLFNYQTEFSIYHQKRIEIIAELYKLIQPANYYIFSLVKPLQSGETDLKEKIEITLEAFNKLSMFFNENRIYFDEQICDKMDSVLNIIIESLSTFNTAYNLSMKKNNTYSKDDSGLWLESYSKIKETLPSLVKDIETSFREIVTIQK